MGRTEASRDSGVLAETLGDAVADAVTTPLLLTAAGDTEQAWRSWLAIRDEVDRCVASGLARDHSPQGAKLLDALGVSLATGVGDAAGLIDRALSATSDPVERADAKRAAAKLGTWCGDVLRTAALTSRAAEEVVGTDDARAAALWLDAATTLAYWGHVRPGRDAAAQARSVAADPDLIAAAGVMEGWTAALSGEPVTVDLPDDTLLGALGDDDVRIGVLVASLLVWTGRHAEARRLLGRVESHAGRHAPDTLPFVLGVVADLHIRSGWWRNADEAITEAEVRARHSGARNVRAIILVRGARLDALRGDDDACRARLAEAERIAHQAGLTIVRLHAASTRALLAVGTGDHERAVAEGHLAQACSREMDLALPGVDRFLVDLIEALVRTGALEEATGLGDDAEASADRLGDPVSRSIAAHGRLLVGDDGEVETAAKEVLALADLVSAPFDRARANLVLGERRRRAGARREARVALTEAHAEFSRLGAAPWADRTAAELRAAGGRTGGSDRADDPLAGLTPQEHRVARFVADGATNQETAAAMYLSHKSIERHLTSIYRKLGVRSRTELGRVVDRAAP